MKEVEINTDHIKLEQLLKWAGIASTGSDAKHIIAEGAVKLNGFVELQRGKKVRDGDVVETGGNVLKVIKR
jgi:ribosome-associated protein